MARRRRNKRPLVVIPFIADLNIGSLVDGDVSAADILSTDLADDFFVIAVKAAWAIRDMTTGEGPIDVGLSHGGLNAAEIEEHLEVVMTSRHDILERERARRPVRRVGVFGRTTSASAIETLNEGLLIKTPMRFLIGLPEPNIRVWARNNSGGPVTAGAQIELSGEVFGRWT